MLPIGGLCLTRAPKPLIEVLGLRARHVLKYINLPIAVEF